MFPIIPQNFQTSILNSARSASLHSVRQLLLRSSPPLQIPKTVPQNVGCKALGAIAANVISKVLPVNSLCRYTNKMDVPTRHQTSIPVRDKDGYLQPIRDEDVARWISCVRISDDIQSHNTILEIANTETEPSTQGLRLRTVRHLADGEELSMWFTEQISALLGIPFLSPANIQGQKRYVCQQCSKLFEYPNPLKIHLALSCGRYTKCHLWERLRKQLQDHASYSQVPLNLSNKQQQLCSLTLLSHKGTASNTNLPPKIGPKRHSAFRPYTHTSPTSTKTNHPANQTDHNTSFINQFNAGLQHTVSTNPSASPMAMAFNSHASQMETLVSNLGKSKQGHLCIYCGKVYSRKYGLKIHIRTHTGFKPLKCKYCFRAFGDPSNLNKHVRLHSQGTSPYKCELCDKVLVRRRDLQRHLQTRHNPSNDVIESNSSD